MLLDDFCNDRFVSSTECPICRASIFDRTEENEALRIIIAETREQWEASADDSGREMLNQQVKILCNDCLTTSTIQFHPYGLECVPCGSFNTARD